MDFLEFVGAFTENDIIPPIVHPPCIPRVNRCDVDFRLPLPAGFFDQPHYCRSLRFKGAIPLGDGKIRHVDV